MDQNEFRLDSSTRTLDIPFIYTRDHGIFGRLNLAKFKRFPSLEYNKSIFVAYIDKSFVNSSSSYNYIYEFFLWHSAIKAIKSFNELGYQDLLSTS